jgi:hypothetical protein
MPTPAEVLGNLDDYGLWLAAVVAGLSALAWLVRKTWRAARTLRHRMIEIGREVDALHDLAQRELTPGEDGEKSTKDYARIAAGHALAIERLEQADKDHETRLRALEAWRRAHDPATL